MRANGEIQLKLRDVISRIEPWIFISSLVALLFLYRLGSERVDKGTEPGMRDLGMYLAGGRSFLDKIDPYVATQMRFGPSLLPFFGILDKVFDDRFLAISFQLTAILGIVIFASIFSKISIRKNFLLVTIVCWLSSVRENLVNIQVTGLLAFLFASGYHLAFSRKKKLFEFMGFFLMAISIDTKPHLFGLTFIVICSYLRNLHALVSVSAIVIANHVILSMFNGHFLTLSWFRTLSGVYDLRNSGELGESLFLWPILEKFGLSESIGALSSTVVCLLLIIYLLFKTVQNKETYRQIIELSLMIPVFGIFFHYYDLAPLIALLYLNLVQERQLKTAISLLPIILIPGNFLSAQNIVLIFGVFLLLFGLQYGFEALPLRWWAFSLTIWSFYIILIESFARVELKQEAQVTVTVMIIIILIIRKRTFAPDNPWK